MSIFHNNSLIGASGSGGGRYAISRSLRFNSADSAFFSRTPASAGNRKTWTWAGWVKRAKLSEETALLSAITNNDTRLFCGFESSNNSAQIYANSGAINVVTAGVFRDLSAWYHIVFSFDTTQATSSNRIKIFINGVQQTLSGTFPNQNTDFAVNNTVQHTLGATTPIAAPANLYLADIHFCDGTAYDPLAFGEFDTNGIWQPKKFTGTYGSQGWKLDFADNSSNTATTLGKDTSGNGNNWTPNNLSVTAGAGNDSLVDVPTNGVQPDTGVGGEVRGNYAVINPLSSFNSKVTLLNGNLDVTSFGTNNDDDVAYATIAIPSTGKWYWEFFITSRNDISLGIAGYRDLSQLCVWKPSLSVIYATGKTDTATQSAVNGDLIGFAIDRDAGNVSFYKNGSLVTTISAFAFPSTPVYPVMYQGSSTGSCAGTFNFGQRPFAYTAPSGFKALCTANLPLPVVTKPSSVFDVKLYTGNSSTQTISGLGFSPDLVWGKARSINYFNTLQDTVRGAGKTILYSNSTDAENAFNQDWINSFNSDGFTMPSGFYNQSSESYVAWCWDAGSSTVTNTAGSITSSVRANASAGFSIVTYTGNGTNGATIGHGLNVSPSLILVKSRDTQTVNSSWAVWHTSLGTSQYLTLNATASAATDSGAFTSTRPTSSVFSVGTYQVTNTSSKNYVAYCFAPVAGYSAFGSYTGNGSTDGPFIYTGFRPRYVLVKASSTTDIWNVVDTARDPYNAANKNLWINQSSAEDSSTTGMDILSNGFKPRTSFNYNGSGVTYIYAAFAEAPFSLARAR
jgi:hypothetical protein